MSNKSLLGRMSLILATLIWGTSFVVLKNAIDDMEVMWVLAIRFVLASFLLALMAGRKIKSINKDTIKGGVVFGITISLAYIVQTYGLKYTTPGKNAFLTATYCILVPFLAWCFTGKKPKIKNVITGVTCLIGIAFVSLTEGFNNMNKGDLLTLGCGIFYALLIIFMEKYTKDNDVTCLSVIEFITAAVFCLVFALFTSPVPRDITTESWMSLLYMGFVCTGVCFFLQAWGMKYTPSAVAAVILPLESVFGVLFSVLFYNEKVTALMLIGFVLIFASVVINEIDFDGMTRQRSGKQ